MIRPHFLSALEVREVAPSRYLLLSDLRYDSAIARARITVPTGFLTDLASVPRLPIVYWLVGGRANYPAVVHDWLYGTHALGEHMRGLSDAVFHEAMAVRQDAPVIVRPVPQPFRFLMWRGVARAGTSSWESGPTRLRVLNPAMIVRPEWVAMLDGGNVVV